MSLKLPHPARTPNSPQTRGDSTWATTPDPSPQPPVMILGLTRAPLHHPQPRLLLTSFGITLTFPTAPTSSPIVVHQTTEPRHHQATYMPHPGTSLYRTGSLHLSLYQPSRNLSPAPQPPISTPQDIVTGRTLRSSTHHITHHAAPHEQQPGSDSPDNSKSSHSLHQSYLHPLSHDMDISQARQAAQTLSLSHVVHHRSSLMESTKVPSRPPS